MPFAYIVDSIEDRVDGIDVSYKVYNERGGEIVVKKGVFGADMKVESVNDGPVTLILDTDELMDTPRR